jgi:1,4-alpha-glucan branching enzyme
VDTKRFSPAPSKDDSQFTVLFAGRLDRQKGIDTLLEAIRSLEGELSREIIFKICGTGPMKNLVERFAKTKTHVDYLGYVPEKDLIRLYKTANLFLMPSRRETFGLAALEAMASGTPVIVTDIAGPNSFVKESFGRKVPPTNPSALAEEIRWFFRVFKENPEELNAMAKSARDISVREFDWDIVIQKIALMIRKVVVLHSKA